MTLTAKQARFVKEYVSSLNGTQAAIAAGYSQRTARAIASENLGKPSIQAEIANQEHLRQTRLIAERDYVIQELVKIADFEIWPAPGSEDTKLGVLMEPEVDHGKAKIYTRVQA